MSGSDLQFMRMALRLARKGYGRTSPNPMVGAVLVKGERVIGRGWHHAAGQPHAEIEALRDAQKRGHDPRGATLYVTLEPCSTHGRTPPCTEALIAAGVKRVVVGTADPNPKHAGKGFQILKKARVTTQNLSKRQRHKGTKKSLKLAEECARLNEAFNHWIVKRTPWVMVKAAMTFDGKIATAAGESKWITGEAARAEGMRFRLGNDAILVGVNTILADDPSLTVRGKETKTIRRIVLDSKARTPLTAKVVSDKQAAATMIVVGKDAPKQKVAALAKRVNVLVAPYAKKSRPAQRDEPTLDLRWLLKRLGTENVTSLLVEGGGEVNASFLLGGLAHRVAFFYAPKILGGRDARRAVAGDGAKSWDEVLELEDVAWREVGKDILLEATVRPKSKG